MKENERLFSIRKKFTDKYGLGDTHINSFGGRIMIYSELEFKNKVKRTLVFVDNKKCILGFDDGKEHDLSEIKISSQIDMERPF